MSGRTARPTTSRSRRTTSPSSTAPSRRRARKCRWRCCSDAAPCRKVLRKRAPPASCMTVPMSSPPSPSRFSVIVPLIVGCAQFMHQFDGTMITTALPVMAVSLNEDPLTLNLAITCYLLALAVFVPISGWMADRYGARRVFLAAIAVFTASSVMCGLSGTLAEIVLWRTVQGIGGAMMTPVGRVIVVKSVPRLEIVRAMNYVTIPAVLAPLIGPSVGGFIVTYFSWPWIFFLNLPIGIAGPDPGLRLRSRHPRGHGRAARPARLRADRAGAGRTGVRLCRARARRAADGSDHRLDQRRRDLRRALSRACASANPIRSSISACCASAPSRHRSGAAACSTSAPPRRCS